MSELLNRRSLVGALAGSTTDALIISGLGSPSWDLAAAGDSERHFYLWGGMGQAVMVGMGIALAQPDRRVVVITGDGEMLMGLGSLASVGNSELTNLGILVLDNETYGETGGQASATRGRVDLIAAASACGIVDSGPCKSISECHSLVINRGPVFRLAKVDRRADPLVLPPRDGAFLKDRFRQGLDLK